MKLKIPVLDDKHLELRNQPMEERTVYMYRYLSLLITSFFYLLGEPFSSFSFKVGVVLFLLISAIVITRLYVNYRNQPNVLKTIIWVEMLGITFLLIPTGGLESPFIWYALNPVLVAATFFTPMFSWLTLVFYIAFGSFVSIYLFYPSNASVSELLSSNSYVILVFILITLAVQMYSSVAKRLHQQTFELTKKQQELIRMNQELKKAKDEIQDSMENLMSLYQTVEAFTGHDDPNQLFETCTEYACRLIKSPNAIFYNPKNSNEVMTAYPRHKDGYPSSVRKIIDERWLEFQTAYKPVFLKVNKETYSFLMVRSNSKIYGVLGVRLRGEIQNITPHIENQLMFLGELLTMILERVELEKVADEFMIREEQNRIANEIHDNVSQRLFGMLYALHSLRVKFPLMPEKEVEEQLKTVQSSVHSAVQELRSSIYGLSSKKSGKKWYGENIKVYLQELSKLNDIKIVFNMSGEEERLSRTHKQAIYRIISEGSGNAIRHGKCKNINIDLVVGVYDVKLHIADNGLGFKVNDVGNTQMQGIGLYNMKSLAEEIGGTFSIQSRVNQGTTIHVNLPINQWVTEKKGGIA